MAFHQNKHCHTTGTQSECAGEGVRMLKHKKVKSQFSRVWGQMGCLIGKFHTQVVGCSVCTENFNLLGQWTKHFRFKHFAIADLLHLAPSWCIFQAAE